MLTQNSMSKSVTQHVLTQTVEALSAPSSLEGLVCGHSFPSGPVLEEIMQLARAVLFPGYYGKSSIDLATLRFHIGVMVDQIHTLLVQQIRAVLEGDCGRQSVVEVKAEAEDKATQLIERLPELRRRLATDVEAAYNGDPAAKSFAEIISCYPTIKALTNYRVAHELYLLQVPLIPRMLTEMAHSETGIDIHPGAAIGDYFAIDHGTGVVIGETCRIGSNVKLYQGVTLGARSFPLDDDGNPIKGIPRHPILEDNVVVYANATILGRIIIGEGCTVGANTWVMSDMAPQTSKYIKEQRR